MTDDGFYVSVIVHSSSRQKTHVTPSTTVAELASGVQQYGRELDWTNTSLYLDDMHIDHKSSKTMQELEVTEDSTFHVLKPVTVKSKESQSNAEPFPGSEALPHYITLIQNILENQKHVWVQIEFNYSRMNHLWTYELFCVTEIYSFGETWIRGFSLEEIQSHVGEAPDSSWDFAGVFDTNTESKEKIWVPMKLQLTNANIKILEEQEVQKIYASELKTFNTNPAFHRLAGDRLVLHGDGGSTHLNYPVWVYPELPFPDKKLLASELHKLAQKRKDMHEGLPVTDIIDPDLFPNRDSTGWTPVNDDDDDYEDDYADGEDKTKYFFTPGTTARSSYKWIPTPIRIHPDGKCEFLAPIHNLALTKSTEPLYGYFIRVFQEMTPLWEKLKLWKRGESVELQVIIKSQMYNLAPNSTYAGKWHTEGLTENIVAAGVYYANISSHLIGGDLIFRPEVSTYQMSDTDQQVKIREGTAAAFSNAIPHRFRKMRNTSATEEGRRIFVNYFVVDPRKPIPDTRTVPSSELVSVFLHKAFSLHTGKELPTEVASLILNAAGYWTSQEEAKKFREIARKAMATNTIGWGYISWGNCGTYEFIKSWDTLSKYKRSEIFQVYHTESSDAAPNSDL
eukprot:TRINITY_DN1591_c0_g1_i1.p1 TRINITY_DN1591_c0_g1~~TRINITY_DN1591_c0_g1_i1.p1  ORF type:complete len:622 (-),score=111.66 TRINITY_DN1591_c0_g1_i1:532-2397(-)